MLDVWKYTTNQNLSYNTTYKILVIWKTGKNACIQDIKNCLSIVNNATLIYGINTGPSLNAMIYSELLNPC